MHGVFKKDELMFSQDDDGQQGLILTVLFGLIALIVGLVIGVGIYTSNQAYAPATAAPSKTTAAKDVAATPAAVTAPDATSTAQAASDAASVKVENGVVKFYFASGKADLAAGAGEALQDVIKEAKAGRKLVISGFHDATGDAGKNAELAKQRALAVRDALKSAGVTEQQIDLKKPEQMTASGSDAEARRVEVTLQ
jgi:outer membrane protein OmpA-like peptidoglycan-associated protein